MTEREPGTVVDDSNYSMLKLPGDQVSIRCLNRRDDISATAQELISQVETSTSIIGPSQPKQLVIGFDCEWPTDLITRALGKLGTVQIACVGHVDTLPQPSMDVLSNPHIVKMGRAVQQNLKKIERDFQISCDGGYDVGTFCKER